MKKQLSEMSLDELKKEEKSTGMGVGLLIGAIIVMTATAVYSTVRGGFSMFTLLPVCFMPLALVIYDRLRKLKAEIRSRI